MNSFQHKLVRAPLGFTLVETLIAITIMTIAIVGPYHAVQTALKVSYTARDELTAASLGQEGIEYVRSQRDSNFSYNTANSGAPGTWLYGIDGSSRGGGGASADCLNNSCTVDVSQGAATTGISQCVVTCDPLNVSASGLYTQQSGAGYTPSRFTRSLKYTVVSAHEIQLTSTVTWVTQGITYSVVLKDNFQNWL